MAFAAFAVLLLLSLAVIVALRSSKPAEELDRIRRAGLPVNLKELDAWYAAVPDDQNAALAVLEAARVRHRDSGELGALQHPKRGEDFPPELLAAISEHVSNNEETLRLLHAAVQLPESRYPTTFAPNTMPNPEIATVKAMAQLLRYEATHEIAVGNTDAAFASVRDGFALAATLRDEPVLISELVRISCAAIAVNSLERALSKQQYSDSQLKEIAEWLARTEADCSRSWQRAVIGERAIGIEHFETVKQAPQPVAGASAWDGIRETLYEGLGFHDRDLRLYLEMMDRLAAAMTNNFPEAYLQSEALSKELDSRFSRGLGRFALVTRMVAPALVKATGKEAALVTHLRCAQAAVAVERYRLSNGGRRPGNVDQLVPTFLPAVPKDGVRGEPLSLQTTERGYEVASPTAAKVLSNKSSTQFAVER